MFFLSFSFNWVFSSPSLCQLSFSLSVLSLFFLFLSSFFFSPLNLSLAVGVFFSLSLFSLSRIFLQVVVFSLCQQVFSSLFVSVFFFVSGFVSFLVSEIFRSLFVSDVRSFHR